MSDDFKALVLREEDGKTVSSVETLHNSDLPEGNVLVAIDYSSLNYKDGLAVTGTGKIIRNFPMVPGIDLAGTVMESASTDYSPGDRVILTGWGVGERYWGGYSQRQRLKSEWLVPMPAGLDSRRAMAIGTAGFTAMLCVMALEDSGVKPDAGTIVVTGAAGGVGSVAVALLAKLGYTVAAVTGRDETHDYLKSLGAAELLSRAEMTAKPRALEAQRWAGGIDTVGSTMLARVLAESQYGGSVAACGLAGGADLPTTVMPFILRGVKLIGVDSVMCPLPRRRAAWERLMQDLPESTLGAMTQEVALAEVPRVAGEILAGHVRGRMLVNPNL
jgi:acrylyl-CoA reductase (NADPH)